MSIVVYTYHDPYRLKDNKDLWDEITSCPYFCVSQTLVNGLKSFYGSAFQIGRVTTVMNLTNVLFSKWVTTSCAVKQHADIDNIIANYSDDIGLTDEELENVKKSFLFNRDEVFTSLRNMFELRINPENIVDKYLTPEQKFIVSVFKKILGSDRSKDFLIQEDFSEEDIDDALKQAMAGAKQASGNGNEVEASDMEHIVIHGVHQFSPLILRTIEEVSKYKKVILLINYQNQYKSIYQTWIDIYSAFDCKIQDFDGAEYHPLDKNAAFYEGNVLAQNIGNLLNGKKDSIAVQHPYKIIEFDNMTEFAGYVAKVFEDAEKKDHDHPMSAMSEQIYAADSSANDILKVYFPDQFGERQFLNYPLGHFFVAVANMWDPETNGIIISDINDIRECLSVGILAEKSTGSLASTFGKMNALFEGCQSVEDMLSRLKKVRKNKKFISDESRQKYVSHISYYAVSENEIKELENALNDLEKLAAFFYEDFEKRPHNFRDFYKRLKKYLQEEILEDRELTEEFTDIISRVLSRLKEVEDIDVSASFECLKSTMSLYLVQETKPGKSANLIVRNFEQIDGDALRTAKNPNSILHFACLTDEDIDSVKQREFTWPLNSEFFEVAQNPVDWKYQVFVKSRKEYKNFKRYALIYGLEFNRGSYKLSFVKRDGDLERDPYYLLKILGIAKERNIDKRINYKLADVSNIQFQNAAGSKFDTYDYFRYKICKRRFLLESIIENNTVYKDSFLLGKYLEVWVENEVKESMQGLPNSELILLDKLNETYDELKKYFPFAENVNRIDIINNVRNRLSSTRTFPVLSQSDWKYMIIRELFIYKQLKNAKAFNQDVLKDKFPEVSQDKVDDELSKQKLENSKYPSHTEIWCKFCTNRELYVGYYAHLE